MFKVIPDEFLNGALMCFLVDRAGYQHEIEVTGLWSCTNFVTTKQFRGVASVSQHCIDVMSDFASVTFRRRLARSLKSWVRSALM